MESTTTDHIGMIKDKFFFLSSKKSNEGLVNNEIQNKLNPYVPIIEIMLNKNIWLEKE